MASKILYTDNFEFSTDQLAQAAWVTDASGLELDYMEYATAEAAQAAYPSSDFAPPSWDLLDEAFANLDDWTDISTGDASVSISPAGQCKHDTGANSAANNDKARLEQVISSIPNTFTVEIKVYHDALGTLAAVDFFRLYIYQADEYLDVNWSSDGLFIRDTDSGVTEVGTDLVKHGGSAEWQTWRFVVTFTSVTGEGTCDVYLNDSTHNWEKVGTTIPCSQEDVVTDGLIRLDQFGYGTNNRITHTDHIKIYDGLQPPSLQCYSEDTIKQQGSYSLKAIAAQTDSLNDTLTKSGLSIDLSGKDALKLDVRAGRTGRNLEVQLRDTGYSSILNEDCSDISDWIDADAVNGESTQVTFDAKSCFKFDTNVAAENNGAERTRNISIADNFNVELNVYLDAVSADTSNAFRIVVSNTNTQLLVSFQSNGLFIYDGSSYNKVGTDLTQQDVWQKWRFEVRGANYLTAKCDVYLNDELKASNIDCSYQTPTSNRILLQLKGYNDNDRIAYLDYINIDTGVHRKSINITSVDTFQEITWDISNIVDTDKDVIDKIIFKILNADAANTFYIDNFRAPESLQCYSEDTIKVQGDYSLKVLAAQTGSLNKTLTKTLTDYLDYSIQDVIKFDIRASRTGSNIKLKIHDVGGDTQEHTINIASANEWQTETYDITGITGTKRDQIDKIIIEISNADFANTIYIDNLYSKVIVETAYTWMGG